MVITKTSWSSTSGGTGLLETLKHDGIDTVLVCGLITSVCVQHSAFGVFEAGYRTILVTDACADRGRARHEAALALYGDYMYELRSVDSLKVELEKKKKSVEMMKEDVEVKGDDMMTMKKHKNGKEKKKIGDDNNNIMSSSIMQGVSVSLPFQKDCGGGISREKMMIKSESNDSLTSATSYDDSVSSIDDDDDAAIVAATTVGGTVVNE